MKKIFNTISVLLLLQSAAYAQQPAHRTTATKVADVLAQQPAEEINKFLEVMKQLEGFSEADIVGLLSGLKPQGQDNAGLEYASNSYAFYVMQPGKEQQRLTYVNGLLQALDKLSDANNKSYVLELLKFCAKARLWYNRPPSKGGSAEWFGRPVQREFVQDTIRGYFSFPIVKVLIRKDDINRGRTPLGGFTDSYVFRLAETYLMRAEAHWWLNQNSEALADINAIRERSNATPLTGQATLDDILDERARELFLEEHRKIELTRIAYTKARLNQEGYSLDNFSENNWFYDRVMEKNHFYREEVFYSTNAYVMRPYHVLYPVPLTAITSNTQGHINQNKGYPGSESNIPPVE